MTLRSKIFVWIFVATATPLLALMFYATTYSENLYREQVRSEIEGSLGNIASEIRRRLLLERELLSGLSTVPAVRDYIPVLAQLAEGRLHEDFQERTLRLEEFLESFQAIITSMSALRVLDKSGRTVIQVEAGRRVDASFDDSSIEPYVEEAPHHGGFQHFLRALLPGEFGYTVVPQDDTLDPAPLLDTVLAFGDHGRTVGYLVSKVRRGPIDRVLHVAPRLHNGRLFIAEFNPANPERDGVILYDDVSGVSFTEGASEAGRLRELYPALYNVLDRVPSGYVDQPGEASRIYFWEYLPYPDQLIVWAVATRVDLTELGGPFQRIRVVIFVAGAIALVIALVLAHTGAHNIVRPVMDLARGLTAYADGERQVRVRPYGSDEIRSAGEAFNHMANSSQRAEEERDQAQSAMLRNAKLASIGRLASGIGHEINNPLNNILALTKLLARTGAEINDPARSRQLVEDINSLRDEALRASRIVKAVLNFAREVPPEYSHFDVGPWLDECLALVHNDARARDVSLTQHLRGSFVLEGDRDLLEQTLINLLLNAIHASPEGSEVCVDVGLSGGDLVITVSDRGAGIPDSALEKVFDPFFTTKPVGEGSGLGLSISLGIVQRHGGELTVSNRLGGGACAVVRLPKVTQQDWAAQVAEGGSG